MKNLLLVKKLSIFFVKMAGEFSKRVENNQNIWTCNVCSEEIINQAKPRGHVCRNPDQPLPTSEEPTNTQPRGSQSVPNSPFQHQYRPSYTAPPPGFNAPPAGFQHHEGEMSALLRFQMLQADQTKQMMMFLQQQNQEMHKMQQEQTELKMNQMMEIMKIQKQTETKVKCPRLEKDENVKNFLNRLKRWNEVEKGRGKYLQLLEALQESGRKSEKQRIELEEQNGLIDPEKENVIKDVIEKMIKWYGKTRIDEASEAWRDFRNIKRYNEEKIDKFLLRFETLESKLKSSAVELPNLILALQLLESVNVNSDQKRNILVHVKVEHVDTVYEEMKSSLRLLKGNLVELTTETLVDDEVNFSKSESFRRSRSKSKQSFADRTFDKPERQRSEERGRSRERRHSHGRSPYRGSSFDRNRGNRDYSQNRGNRDYSQNRENRDYSRNRSNRDYSQNRGNRDYSRNRYYGDKNSRKSYESVNLIFKETGEEANVETKENTDKMIVDSGTTKTVAGIAWMKNYLEMLPGEEKKKIKKEPEERYFRFGNSVRYPSKEEITIPLRLGKLDTELCVSLVDASIPLLVGKSDLKRLGFIINFEEETVFITKTFETFPLETTIKGHLALPITEGESLDEAVFLMEECDREKKEKKIKKIHQVLAHPLPEILKTFFKNSSDNDKDVLKLIDEVHAKCNVCRTFKKSPSKPKVGLPVSSDFNECVALDLKERKTNKEYILYCICTFSRLTRGVIIKDKNPSTIVKGVIDCWVLGKGIGPGIPGKFLFDNGGEFNNPEVIDLAEKHGIKMHGTTAAHSPFSNGLCEKNHEVVDRMMAKLMAGDKSLKPADALNHALFAKNVEPNNKGFSSFQIVYGTNPTIPGVSNSTPPSLSTEYTSKDVRDI